MRPPRIVKTAPIDVRIHLRRPGDALPLGRVALSTVVVFCDMPESVAPIACVVRGLLVLQHPRSSNNTRNASRG
jgi:hypothetical protein